jgi:RNA polymerase sigma-70 factor (ECF subfamily)
MPLLSRRRPSERRRAALPHLRLRSVAVAKPSRFANNAVHPTLRCRRCTATIALTRTVAADRRFAGTPSRRLFDRAGALATYKELSDFLEEIERRAYKQAIFAVRDGAAALDIVQDAMLKLAENYAARPAAELPPLFQRILQNTIHDHYRRRKLRMLWTLPLSALATADGDDDGDILDTLENGDGEGPGAPPRQLEQAQMRALIEKALQELPLRQRQAFLLRYWEEMDVAETAAAMGCSEGSVKTHCSRATHALAVKLKQQGIG